MLDVDRYPTIEFDSAEVAATAAGWDVRGLLTVHGTVASVALTVTEAKAEQGFVRLASTARVDRRRFGVTRMRAAASSAIDITIDAVASRLGTGGMTTRR